MFTSTSMCVKRDCNHTQKRYDTQKSDGWNPFVLKQRLETNTYGVATISRLLKITGLFWKRAL